MEPAPECGRMRGLEEKPLPSGRARPLVGRGTHHIISEASRKQAQVAV